MKSVSLSAAVAAAAMLLFSASASFAKDKEIKLQDAPAGVQATIKKMTDAGATSEKVELKRSGNTQYGVRSRTRTACDGGHHERRWNGRDLAEEGEEIAPGFAAASGGRRRTGRGVNALN